MPQISSDAPGLANLTFGAVRAAGTMLAWLFSDYFERMPGLKIALSEGNIGWMPYFIERAEQVIDKQRHWAKRMGTAFYDNQVALGGAIGGHIDLNRSPRWVFRITPDALLTGYDGTSQYSHTQWNFGISVGAEYKFKRKR